MRNEASVPCGIEAIVASLAGPEYEPLSKEEEIYWGNRIKADKNDKEAEDMLLLHNLKYVCSLVMNVNAGSFGSEDLFQEGIFGLKNAILKFDPQKGRLSTFSRVFILHSLQTYCSKNNQSLKISAGATQQLQKLKKITNHYLTTYNRLPLIEEYEKEMKISKEKISDLLALYQMDFVPINSYDEEDTIPLEEMIPDENARFEETIENKMIADQCCSIIDSELSELDSKVIKASYGFESEGRTVVKSRNEVAKELNITAPECDAALYRGIILLQNNEKMESMLSACF